MIFPNLASYTVKNKSIMHNLPTFKGHGDFKSIIQGDKLYIFMTSRRKEEKLKSESQRTIIPHSHIYWLELRIGKQFQLLKLNTDSRPGYFQNFGILPITKGFILFGGDYNSVRNTYLFDILKKEICKCNIYTGD